MLDPKNIQRAVMEFVPKRPPKFHELMVAKEWIAELRGKRASYESIADLLTQHCLPVSKSAIAMFCHEVLGECIRSRRRPARRRSPMADVEKPFIESPSPNVPTAPSSIGVPTPVENTTAKARGPRIAKIELINPP